MAMPRAGARTLSDIKESRVRIVCTRCTRAGEYDVQRLIQRYGDVAQPDLLTRLSADCPLRKESASGRGCGVRYAPD